MQAPRGRARTLRLLLQQTSPTRKAESSPTMKSPVSINDQEVVTSERSPKKAIESGCVRKQQQNGRAVPNDAAQMVCP